MRARCRTSAATRPASTRCCRSSSSSTTRCRSTSSASAHAIGRNTELEFERTCERYAFLRWGQSAFDNFSVVRPASGSSIRSTSSSSRGVVESRRAPLPGHARRHRLAYDDGERARRRRLGRRRDRGRGGDARRADLLPDPEVVGFNLTGRCARGRRRPTSCSPSPRSCAAQVVGKFVEFFGEGAAALPADRATISNMAPEYGATIGFFPLDERSILPRADGPAGGGRGAFRAYYGARGCSAHPGAGRGLQPGARLDLATVDAAVAGPKRPQDRIPLSALKRTFEAIPARIATATASRRARPPVRRGRVAALDPGGGSAERQSLTGATKDTSTLHRVRDDQQPADAGRGRRPPPRRSPRAPSSSGTATW